MKPIIMRITLFTILLFLLIIRSASVAAESRTALVIGNGSYTTGSLKNPVNDADDMASTLKRLGFDVILKTNATQQDMEDAIRNLGDRLKKGGVGLFFYAGHGVQIAGKNYLLPIGARIDRETDVKYRAMDVDMVLDEMGNAGNNMNIVILDACRDNPFGKIFRTASRGLAIISSAPRGTLISYSTSPGNLAADGSGRNSPYAASLLKHMKTPGLPIENVFKNVRQDLGRQTGGRQIPWELTSLEGQFYFSMQNISGSDVSTEQTRINEERRNTQKERELFEERKLLAEERKRLEKEQPSFKQEQVKLVIPRDIASTMKTESNNTFSSYNGNVIKIGAIFSATGPASPLGVAEKNTALLLQEQINARGGILGKKLEIVFYDDGSAVDKAVAAADNLLKRDRVSSVVGPTTTPNTLAIANKFSDAGIPLISCGAGEKIVVPVNKWVFKTPQSDRLAVAKIINDLKSRKLSKIAIISVSDAYGQGGREMLKTLSSKVGIEIVADEVHGQRDRDVTHQLNKIKGTDAMAIVSWCTPQTGAAIIAKNRKQLGMTIPLYMSHGVAASKFIELASNASEGILLPVGKMLVADQIPSHDPQKIVLTRFIKDYEVRFRSPVSTFAGHAWDAIMLIVKAIELGKSDMPSDIRANVERIRGFAGTGGIFNFYPEEHNGLDEGAFEIITIRNGRWTYLN